MKIVKTTSEKQRTEFIHMITQFSANTHSLTLAHHAFGNISTHEWGIATYKHMDYQLRQFGV